MRVQVKLVEMVLQFFRILISRAAVRLMERGRERRTNRKTSSEMV